jgi:hypothetical protein
MVLGRIGDQTVEDWFRRVGFNSLDGLKMF